MSRSAWIRVILCLLTSAAVFGMCASGYNTSNKDDKTISAPIEIPQADIEETDIMMIEPEPVPEIILPDIEAKYEEEIVYLSKTVWGEARGCSKTEQAAVVWCILNRADSALRCMPDTIIGVITQKNQFAGYRESFSVMDDIRVLVIDVLTRWEMEKAGEPDVGRVLPKDYLYFTGDGTQNRFRTEYQGGETWDWTLESPY